MKKKVLYVWGGASYHATPTQNKLFQQILADDGRFEAELTNDLDALTNLRASQYAAVVLYTSDQHAALTSEREHGLLSYIRAVIDAAQRSSACGHSVPVAAGCE